MFDNFFFSAFFFRFAHCGSLTHAPTKAAGGRGERDSASRRVDAGGFCRAATIYAPTKAAGGCGERDSASRRVDAGGFCKAATIYAPTKAAGGRGERDSASRRVDSDLFRLIQTYSDYDVKTMIYDFG